jgi:hypothetical protein
MADALVRNWQDDSRRRQPRRKGFQVQEERGAMAHPDGEQTRGSGCSQRPSRKGDSVGTLFRQSCKTTEKDSIRLERAWWDEVAQQALATGHTPMLVVGFDAGPRQGRCDLAAFDLRVAEYMTKAVASLLNGETAEARAFAGLAVGRTKARDV